MLGRLERDVYPGQFAELARPHPGAVDHELRLDVALRGADPGHRAAAPQEPGNRHALDDPGATHPGSLGQRHRHVDRVHPPVARDVEPGEHVVGPREREQARDLGGRDLVDLHPAQPVERGDPPVLLEPPRLDRQFDQPDLFQPGRLAGLRLQPRVQVPGVHPQLGRGLRGGAERRHQPRRVPRGARGQPVPLQQDDVRHAQVRQVIGDRSTDDAAAHDDDSRAVRDSGGAGSRHASSTTSSRPARRSSASMPGSVTASVSVLMPMQQFPLCEMRVIIAAQPGSGPNGYMWVIREPAMYTGNGTPGMLETWTSFVLVSRPEIALTTGAGSQPTAGARAAGTVSAAVALAARASSTNCRTAAILAAGSVSAMGAANLAPVNRFPPCGSSWARRLIGNPTVSRSSGAPCRSWYRRNPPITPASSPSLSDPPAAFA